jgi:hypothetical protein
VTPDAVVTVGFSDADQPVLKKEDKELPALRFAASSKKKGQVQFLMLWPRPTDAGRPIYCWPEAKEMRGARWRWF